MGYQNQSVMNSTGGSLTVSSTEGKEYLSLSHFSGSNSVLNNNGISISSPNNYQMKIDNDSFSTVMGDHNTFHGQNSWERVTVDKHLIIGDSVALLTDAHERWSTAFADIVAATTQPETKVESFPIVPGVDPKTIPRTTPDGTNKTNPAVTELQNDKTPNDVTLSFKNLVALPLASLAGATADTIAALKSTAIAAVSAAAGAVIDEATAAAAAVIAGVVAIEKSAEDLAKKIVADAKSLSISKLSSGPDGKSTSTQGGTYAENSDRKKIPDIITATQDKLNEIEPLMGEGGNSTQNITRNKRVVVGAAVNLHPQAVVNPTGREVASAVYVDKDGSRKNVAGVPELHQVDNASVFPCGDYHIEVGNTFSVLAGGGGITLTSTSHVDIISDAIVKIGSYQVVIGGEDVNIKGGTNISIGSPNLNLNSDNQIMLNGNVGVGTNLLVNGGVNIAGETFLQHITAPMETQETNPGFTTPGAYGFLRNGAQICSTVFGTNITLSLDGVPIYEGLTMIGNLLETVIIPTGSTADSLKQVELYPHAHQFPNLPLTLIQSSESTGAQSGVSNAAVGINDQEKVTATPIKNENKAQACQWIIPQIENDISQRVYV